MSKEHNNNADLTLGSLRISPDVFAMVPFEIMERLHVIPLDLKDGKMIIACVDPSDAGAMDQLRVLTGFELETIPVSKKAVADFLKKDKDRAKTKTFCDDLSSHTPANVSLRIEKGTESQAVGNVEKLFNLALDQRASDIHLEPQKEGLFVRFRIDGTLKTIHEFPKTLQPAIISRIKILASLNITEKRLPQDGQIGFRAKDKEIDLRVSTLPAKYGEKVVIRLLDKMNSMVSLDTLGFEHEMESLFESIIEKPYGLLLVTGPTGSGKTTTLYSVLNRLRSPMKNIITLEDPIEYELLSNRSNETGITQVQVNSKIGLTFAASLRAALRQDPDVIMVGEIRDKETAEIAMKSAMTGHMVMSTLHTNDAPSTLERLKDMGIEPYLIASTVIGVLAQRLVRVLCAHCKQGYKPPLRSLKNMFAGKNDIPDLTLYRAAGCEQCQKSGYRGRKGIFELLVMNEELKHAVNNGGNFDNFKKLAVTQGLKTLRMSGLELVMQGITTIEEIFRCTVE